jgi:hypothetical protein
MGLRVQTISYEQADMEAKEEREHLKRLEAENQKYS